MVTAAAACPRGTINSAERAPVGAYAAGVTVEFAGRPTTSRQHLLTLIDQGVRNGRISPQLASYIAAEIAGGDVRKNDENTARLDKAEVSFDRLPQHNDVL